MAGSKVMMSPLCASSSAWRKVPEPLSAALVTVMVSPCGTEVGVAATEMVVGVAATEMVVGVAATEMVVGDGPKPQPATRTANTTRVVNITHFFFLSVKKFFLLDFPKVFM